MALLADMFRSLSATRLRPRLACEVTPEGVFAARQEAVPDAPPMFAFRPLPPGAIVGGLKPPNLLNPQAVVSALRSALDEVAARERTLTVVIPDASVRVLLLDFDSIPAKQAEALAIIRFRLRKQLPFEIDESAISYQVMQSPPGQQRDDLVRALVIATPTAVLAEYETAVREAGYEPGVVLPSTLAAMALLPGASASLLINRNGNSVTTAITRENELLLHRTLDLPPDPAHSIGELQRMVSVAVAYFEDTLEATPENLLYVGAGGAAELAGWLGQEGSRVRDLIDTPFVGASSQMPRGLLAGVVGALAD